MKATDQGKTFVAGHRGMVGSALLRTLRSVGAGELVTRDRQDLDLCCQQDVADFFSSEKIDRVFLAAARVGGIKANSLQPADFIRENLQIQSNVIDASYRCGVSRLVFLGSSCIYPRMAAQPMREEALLTGPLERSNEAYAIAKIAGIKMCESYRRQYGCDFRSVMPTNLYGPNDNFDLESSHVLPALLRKFHHAAVTGSASVTVWGSGRPRREFLHVDDLAEACVHLMDMPEHRYWEAVSDHCSHVNVGTGKDISIAELADLVRSVTGFEGRTVYDESMPDGTPRKRLDVSLIRRLGWEARIPLEAGVRQAYQWMTEHWDSLQDG